MTDTTVLVLSDTHGGNKKSLRSQPVDKDQKIILKNYREICRRVSPDVVIMLGDMVDGFNPKGQGLGLWTCDLQEQIDDMYRLLKMTGARRYYGVTGTPYHTSTNLNADACLYEAIGADYGTDMSIDIDGVTFYCCHKIGTSASIYQQSAMSVQLTKAAIWKDELGDFDVQLRGHAHYFAYQGTGNHLGVICPCWKGRDEFGASRGMAFKSDLGAVYFKIHDGEYSWGHHLFKLPGELQIQRYKYEATA